MFPSSTTPIRSAARRGLDLAVEFATLGEYRISEAPQRAPRPTRRRPLRPPAPSVELARPASRLAPASAAARRQGVRLDATPVATAEGLRALALPRDGVLAGPRPRRRGGQATSATQLCLSPLEH